ncbi:hypothetical protein [Corynebacterium sp. Marseille-P4321]|uniref:hypothetical protein n=1 Tax=Corynebacterium sp. Marseille-P4321 TaxID=2736603 RepID=UPI00158CDDB0|nr:hypothetical protein [Corynebacterium sp. Marseille-P4321]
MHSYGYGRRRNPILITSPVSDVAELSAAISAAVFGRERPAPRNLDGLADLLREVGTAKVVVSDWCIDDDRTRMVLQVFADVGVELVR